MRTKRAELCRRLIAVGFVSVACLGAEGEARATLGRDVASVVANQQRLAGTRQVTKLPSGERHELVLPSGVVVEEYVSPAGAVYAITWRGPRMPDLRELLGSYFSRLAAHPRAGHHRMSVTGADLVVRSSGHRRSFTGRAWVPSLVPSGVDVEAVLP
ncbi:MAG TPA: DUF2844 domain-containing protein [Polyangiaceae bacterium]|nr:DUF2844 domain-containing protein [Polyangiaceae bacterium]